MEDEMLLFRKLKYNSDKEISDFLDNMNDKNALQIIKLAIEDAVYSNVFTMVEIEALSKAFRVITDSMNSK